MPENLCDMPVTSQIARKLPGNLWGWSVGWSGKKRLLGHLNERLHGLIGIHFLDLILDQRPRRDRWATGLPHSWWFGRDACGSVKPCTTKLTQAPPLTDQGSWCWKRSRTTGWSEFPPNGGKAQQTGLPEALARGLRSTAIGHPACKICLNIL